MVIIPKDKPDENIPVKNKPDFTIKSEHIKPITIHTKVKLKNKTIPTFYFLRPNKSLLRFVRTHPDLRALGKACSNGASEMMTNLSASVVGMLYNWQLIRIAGEDGVAAYGVMMYVAFIFMAFFIIISLFDIDLFM